MSLENKAEVYREANSFCAQTDNVVETLRVITTPARPGQLGYTELHFRCSAPGQASAGLQDTLDLIIETRTR